MGYFPDGLDIDKETGIISGTAEKPGEFKFTIHAYNQYADTTKELTITVGRKPSSSSGGGCDTGFGIFAFAVLFALKGAKKS